MLIIDCNNLAYVCHFSAKAESDWKNQKGYSVHVIENFIERMISICEKYRTIDASFCWDSKKSYRRVLYPEYKKRKKSEEDMSYVFDQFVALREEILPKMGWINQFLQSGYEADDLIAEILITSIHKKNVVVTSDHDLFQILDYAKIFDPMKYRQYTKTSFKKEYGIEPRYWGWVKAVGGCSSDNIPGIKGVGESKALAYLKKELPSHHKTYQKIENEDISLWQSLVNIPFRGGRKEIKYPEFDKVNLSIKNFAEVVEEWELFDNETVRNEIFERFEEII